MRRLLASRALLLALLLALAPRLAAQHLRDDLSDLFIFGEGHDPLFLGGTGDPNNPEAIRIHGDHFVPAAVASNGTVISFLTNSIGSNVANVPVSATSGGSTFSFEGGMPVRTSTSAGPVFGERAQTLGRGRVLAALSRTGVTFKTLRGVDLANINFTFTHANSDFPGCDSIAGGDCSLLGVPSLENETIDLTLALDVKLTVTSFLLTYGITDRLDIGVVLPLVTTSLEASSQAQINPFGPPPAVHLFGGTPDNPILTASRSVRGSATGIGDVDARVKANCAGEIRSRSGSWPTSDSPPGARAICWGRDRLPRGGWPSSRRDSVTSRRTRTWATCTGEARSKPTRCWARSGSTT